LGFRITQRFSLPNDFVDVRGFNWDVRILKAQRISEESWRSYFDTVSVRGQRGDKISRRRADSLVQVASAYFKATRRRLPVGAVLFNRNTDDFREQRLDDQTGVRVVRRYRGKRTTLAANECLPVGIVKRDCSAQFLQQIKGGQDHIARTVLRVIDGLILCQTDSRGARDQGSSGAF
jgi:hypothetical protein